MILPALYHWAPTERRDSIRRGGLQPYSPPTVCSGGLAFPCVCLAPTPSAAWSISGDMDWVSEIEEWDLWQVRLPDGAEVHIRSGFGPRIVEIKVHTAIPADCVWFVAQRTPAAARP